jgi:hypothetical protein
LEDRVPGNSAASIDAVAWNKLVGRQKGVTAKIDHRVESIAPRTQVSIDGALRAPGCSPRPVFSRLAEDAAKLRETIKPVSPFSPLRDEPATRALASRETAERLRQGLNEVAAHGDGRQRTDALTAAAEVKKLGDALAAFDKAPRRGL